MVTSRQCSRRLECVNVEIKTSSPADGLRPSVVVSLIVEFCLRPEPCRSAMTTEETRLYRRIICEQITLQELQCQQDSSKSRAATSHDPIGLTRRIKHQRRMLSRLWATANALNSRRA